MLRVVLFVMMALAMVSAKHKAPDYWQDQIDAMKADVDDIIDYVLNGEGKGQTYKETAHLTDIYGTRLSGTPELEQSIDYLMGRLSEEFGAENVHTEEVMVPHWSRGEERAHFTMPESGRQHDMYIMTVGTSVGTQAYPDGELTAPIIIVKSFDELEDCQVTNIAADKIIVYNQPWAGYTNVFEYRTRGASVGAKCGALGVLIRSLTQFSIYSPHTGTQTYDEDLNEEDYIPAACITTEDADLLQRLLDDGNEITMTMYMTAENLAEEVSRNLFVDIPGTHFPDEYVIFGGHIDSWDVGTGAMDDAGGVVISWKVLSVLKNLGIQPKRTLRAIFWTAEEIGASGANVFYESHKDFDVSLIMESDAGTFTPTGLGFSGSDQSRDILSATMELLEAINVTGVTDDMLGSVDLAPWLDADRQAAVLNNIQGSDGYFLFHHTEGDTMTVQDSHDLDLCTIMWTTVAFVVGNFDDMLPEEDEPVHSGVGHVAVDAAAFALGGSASVYATVTPSLLSLMLAVVYQLFMAM